LQDSSLDEIARLRHVVWGVTSHRLVVILSSLRRRPPLDTPRAQRLPAAPGLMQRARDLGTSVDAHPNCRVG
jgi:hypothetical protein